MGIEKFRRRVYSDGMGWPNDRGVIQGWYDYDDTATSTTPISLTASTWTKLTNNGLGAQTSIGYGLPHLTNIYNTTSHQFGFSTLQIGDTADIRVSFLVTPSVNNQTFKVSLFLGVWTEYEYAIPVVSEQPFKTQAEHRIGANTCFYIGNELTRDNPGELRIWSDDEASVKVDGWFVRVLSLKRRNM